MIPFIRSLSELMAITASRELQKDDSENNNIDISTEESGERERYIRSIGKKEVNLPYFPKTIRNKWRQNKKYVSRFIDDLEYNNHIQPSYDLTLIERQNNRNQQDVA